MTEYWKSYAKKYCDVCKCWITDNKASVQFHENGKRHKENVGKKINELVKRATKEGKEKKELDEDMKRMEEDALKAYMKDIEDNPDHSAQFVKKKNDPSVEERDPAQGETSSSSKHDKPAEGKRKTCPEDAQSEKYVSGISSERVWYEAKSDQGYSYYWNSQTNESVWEAPEGYVTIEEQNKEMEKEKSHVKKTEKRKQMADAETAKRRKEEVDAAVERERMKEKYAAPPAPISNSSSDDEDEPEAPSSVGPQAKSDAYGAWTTVVRQQVAPVDLQLPPSYQPVIQPAAYTSVEPRIKIKEKTIDRSKLGSDGGPSNFKKRKINNRGNARQRFDDDDE